MKCTQIQYVAIRTFDNVLFDTYYTNMFVRSENDMCFLKGASHCEIDAKVLEEVGVQMYLRAHLESFRYGAVGIVFAAERMGLVEPLVSKEYLNQSSQITSAEL